MDPKPYKVVKDLYRLFESLQGQMTDREIGYITGCFKTLVELYDDPLEVDEPLKKRSFTDIIFKGEQ